VLDKTLHFAESVTRQVGSDGERSSSQSVAAA